MATRAIPIETINKRLPAESKLTAIEYVDGHVSKSGTHRRKVRCKCVCGKEKKCVVADLIRGNPLSCGCSYKGRKPGYKFGDSTIYKRWYDMRERCYNPKNRSYKNYGAVGVIVCPEWRNDYQAFAIWSLENGYSPELQLDKDIKALEKPGKLYSPDTCTWATPLENMSYRKSSVKYLFQGQNLTIPQISRLTCVLQANIKAAIKAGKTIEQAVKPEKRTPKFKIY